MSEVERHIAYVFERLAAYQAKQAKAEKPKDEKKVTHDKKGD